MKRAFSQELLGVVLTVLISLTVSCSSTAATPSSISTITAATPSLVTTSTVSPSTTREVVPTIETPTLNSPSSQGIIRAGIGEIVEVDGWQFVVDYVNESTTLPDASDAPNGHIYKYVGLTVKNNSDKCRQIMEGILRGTFATPKKYTGGQLYSPSDFNQYSFPLLVPWVLDARGYGHAGATDGIFLGYTFNAPPKDVWHVDLFFDVPIANADRLELHLDTVDNLSVETIVFDLNEHSANRSTLTAEFDEQLNPIGKTVTIPDKWAITVDSVEFGRGFPGNKWFGAATPPTFLTIVKATVQNLHGIDMRFPITEDNPNLSGTDFYAVDSRNQVASTNEVKALSQPIAPGQSQEVEIPLYSIFQPDASNLRFTMLLNAERCEYANFDISSK